MISAFTFLFSFLTLTLPDGGLGSDAGQSSSEPSPKLQVTAEPDHLRVKNLHLVIERKGENLRISQIVTLASSPGRIFRGGEINLALPKGATAPGLDASMESLGAVYIRDNQVSLDAAVPPQGLDVSYHFEVPIREGTAEFEQALLGEIGTARLVCTWTEGDTRLIAAGFPEAKKVELGTGIHGLMTMGAGLPGGKISVRVEGLRPMPGEKTRWIVLAVCVLFVLLGVAARFIRPSGKMKP